MPSPTELAAEIQSLIPLVPTSTVFNSRLLDNECRIALTLESWESFLLFTYCAQAANVRLHAYSRYDPGSPEALGNPARAIVHEYIIEGRDSEDFRGHLQTLGAFIVWKLYAAGHIETNAANRALTLFHAAHVPRGRFE